MRGLDSWLGLMCIHPVLLRPLLWFANFPCRRLVSAAPDVLSFTAIHTADNTDGEITGGRINFRTTGVGGNSNLPVYISGTD